MRSSRALTANTVLENEKAKPTSAASAGDRSDAKWKAERAEAEHQAPMSAVVNAGVDARSGPHHRAGQRPEPELQTDAEQQTAARRCRR